ncbi:MAG: MATE family efflux transporter [Sphingomonadales bacterium 32-67-7]|nr:MAG: MATE family efflux transporter [Sphingomonadales bacterium 32-67-7]
MTNADPLSWRGETLATLRIAGPLALANLAQMLVHAIDVIFVARLGPGELAAASLSVSLFGLMIWSLSGMAGMVAALIAAELGRKRHAVREVRRSARMGLWLAFGTGIAAMGVCALGEQIMRAAGQDPRVAALGGDFLGVLMWACVPALLANVLRNFVSALGRPVFATMITVLAIGVSALGNYALVFGNLGLPALGLRGSALASTLTSVFMLLAYVAVIRSDRRLRRYRVFGNWWRPEWRRLRELVRKGLPVTLTILAEAGLFSGAAFLMGLIGPQQLAGHTIALQLAAIGRAGWSAIGLGTGFMLITAALMLFAPITIIRLYLDPDAPANAALVGHALAYMTVAAAFQLVDGLQVVTAGALRGLQDTRRPMWIALFGYWVPGLGTAIALGFFTPLAGTGIWIGLAVGLVVVAILLMQRWSGRARLGLLPA